MSVSLPKTIRPLNDDASAALGTFFYKVGGMYRVSVNFDRPVLTRHGLDLVVCFDLDISKYHLGDNDPVKPSNRIIHSLMNTLNRGGLMASFYVSESKYKGFKHYQFRICLY